MDTTKIRGLFFNNLLILGFDKASVEKKLRITINKDMFCVPNQKKLFEEVTNFLFSKLNEVSSKKYVLPWPVLEKDQQRQFQKTSFNHLSAIALESNVKFPRFTFSLLATFSGDRFYELYLAFSNHVLQRTIIETQKDVLLSEAPETLDQENSQVVADLLRIDTISSVEKFQQVNSCSLDYLKSLFQCAKEMEEVKENLRSCIFTNSVESKTSLDTLRTLYCVDKEESGTDDQNDLTIAIMKSMTYEKKVKELWITFEKFIAKEKELWECVSYQVSENPATFCIDGSNLVNIVASDDIRNICPELNEVSNVVGEDPEKLSLLKYLQSFCILLEFYLNTSINRESLQVNELCYRKNISSLEENLKRIKSLNEKLGTKILPSMKENTKNLEESLLLPKGSEELEDFIKQYPSMICCSAKFQEQINCSRRQFQEKFRTQMFSSMPLSGDAGNSSLLVKDYTKCLEDVSIESRSSALSESTAQESNSLLSNSFPVPGLHQSSILSNSEKFIDETQNSIQENKPDFVTELHQSSTLSNSEKFIDETQNSIQENKSEFNLSFDLNFPEFESSFEKFSQNVIPDTTIKEIVQDSPSFDSPLCIEDFEIDSGYKKPYKMRESWHLEDSLNAMTLPDMDELE